MRHSTLLKIPGVGARRAALIADWQQHGQLSPDATWMSPLVRADALRLLQLRQQIQQLQHQIHDVASACRLYSLLRSIPGFGVISAAELTAEIGSLQRFRTSDALALFLGAAPLDHSSGKRRGSRRARLVNRTAKNALCTATGRHRRLVPESSRFFQRKLTQNGGRYARAVRALARYLVRVIWSMAKHNREYEIRTPA